MLYSLFPQLILLILLFLVIISPLYSFVLIVFFLTVYDFSKTHYLRKFLSLILVFLLIFIFGSIDFSSSTEIPDYYIYYQANTLLKGYSLNDFYIWPFQPEFGWSAYFWSLNKLGLDITEINQVALINFSTALLLFYLWFEIYALEDIEKKFHGIATASTYLFISVFTLTFLQRQSLSVVFLLFAISNNKNKKFYLYLLLASIFHITSLPIGILYKFLINKNIGKKIFLIIFIIFIIFRIFFLQILSAISSLGFANGKIDFYLGLNSFSVVSIRLALYVLIFNIILFLFFNDLKGKFKNIIIFTAICSISLLGINLASERLNFITI
ncbi:EpsG family protein, partial [Acinetobacter guerrae]